MIMYVCVVALINSIITKPFLPEYALCMRCNPEEVKLFNEMQYLLLIPFTLVIGVNLLFDFDDIPIYRPPRLSAINSNQNIEPILDESPLRTSIFSFLFFVFNLISRPMFLQSFNGLTDMGIYLIFFIIKGPLIAAWTNHQLKQKKLKKNQQKMDEVELSISAQAQYSQLENAKDHVSNVL